MDRALIEMETASTGGFKTSRNTASRSVVALLAVPRRLGSGLALPAGVVAAATLAWALSAATARGQEAAATAPAAPSQSATSTKSPEPGTAAVPETPVPELPIDQRPYRVLVQVVFGPHSTFTPQYRRVALEQSQTVIRRMFGLVWELQLTEVHSVVPPNRQGLERLRVDQLTTDFDETDFDKVYFIVVETAGAHYHVSGREWDTRLRELGAVEAVETFDRNRLPDQVASVLIDAFRPVLEIHSADVETGEVELRAQAGNFQPGDVEEIGLREGDVIVPFFRYFDRKNVLRRIDPVPLTYLLVAKLDRGRTFTNTVSGLRVPLGLRKRRIEQLGLAVRPRDTGTLVKLVPRTNPNRPLVGHNVRLEAKLRHEDDPVGEPVKLMTDRRGLVQIPIVPEQSVVWLYVNSGSLLLARVPFVPGLKPEETIPLPDDELRLGMEGEIHLLQQRMIETIAKRSSLIAQAKAAARGGKSGEAGQHITAISELPDMREFQSQLTALRVPALEQARASGDRSTETKIQKMCEQTGQMITKFLDDEPVRRLAEELGEIQRLNAEDALQ